MFIYLNIKLDYDSRLLGTAVLLVLAKDVPSVNFFLGLNGVYNHIHVMTLFATHRSHSYKIISVHLQYFIETSENITYG